MGLTFFVELPIEPLVAMLARPGVQEALRAGGAGLAMALLDLSPARADVVRQLEAAGIPVTAWLLLPTEDGYWLTADNAELAAARYEQARAWAEEEGLRLQCVGLDIELPHDDAVALVEAPWATLRRLLARRRPRATVQAARARYGTLVERIRADGREVETYQFPFVQDARRAGGTLLARTLGILDVPADREVLMLYRSVLPEPWGGMLVDAYGSGAQAIAVGITGGGVGSLQPAFADRELDLQRLLGELRRARRYTERLYVFSLEGCVEAGMLEAVCLADLYPASPSRTRPLALAGRRLAQGTLRLAARAEAMAASRGG